MPEMSPPPYDFKEAEAGAEGYSNDIEEGGDFRIAYWVEKNVRQAFIRKVYSIITLQLLVTVGIVSVFTFVTPVKLFVQRNIALYFASYVVFLIIYFILVFWKSIQRRFPWNIILMTIFTLAMGAMAGIIASMHETKAVILAMIITAAVSITVTIFSFQTKVDFTTWTGFFAVLATVVIMTSCMSAVVLTYKYVPWLDMLFAAIGAIVFTLFLAYDTQLLLGHKTITISPEDYVFAAILIYIDVIYIFFYILRIVGRR
ncbi:protein lifeguard 3-like [Hemicordylus capensis]|uniref:protein lifeguard 3-like n=1 Tax=Hemicordylus capensis TaxID=884348 RepID=UPI00230312E4|nr:protein lifeguard 3-like [Hemicordylus capensis]